MKDDESILSFLYKDGRVFLAMTAWLLIASGCFALFLTFTGYFLPHDAIHIGYTAPELSLISPNLVKFMFHDRAAFGSILIVLGFTYLWLIYFPLTKGFGWAWSILSISGVFGFGSFLSYIGYGYLDSWHGIATLFLLPIFLWGMFQCHSLIQKEQPLKWLLSVIEIKKLWRVNKAKLFLLVYAFGLMFAGVSISIIGMTTVFVPQDVQFIELCGTNVEDLSNAIIGVVAHDRAGFGGGLLTTGVCFWLILLNSRLYRSLWELLLLTGIIGFVGIIGVHFYVGYIDFIHLLPAYLGLIIFGIGIVLSHSSVQRGSKR